MKSFALSPGTIIANKYVVGHLLGSGWEGEVYLVTERGTRIERAAKLFFPSRNRGDRAVKFYATKLNKLRTCPTLIQYCTQESIDLQGKEITALISEYAPGELLPDFLARQKNRRLHPFEALHLLHSLVSGLVKIHACGEYHGDLHIENVIVRRRGLGFEVRTVDLFNWGKRTNEHVHNDICDAIRILYEVTGGARTYYRQPAQVKHICCGLKRTLIRQRFRTAAHLLEHLETLEWE